MATHDYILANASGAAFRTDLNNALAAIVSNNSNSSSPSTTYAYQWWADTSAGVLKIRNSANNAWIELLQLDGTLTLEDGTESAPALAFRTDLDTGLRRGGANDIRLVTAGEDRFQITGAGAAIVKDGKELALENDDENANFSLKNEGASGQTQLTFNGGSGEVMRIDASGRLLVGNNSSRAVKGINGQIEVEGLNANTSAVSIIRNSADTNSPYLLFGKSRGTADGAVTAIQENDEIGNIIWAAADGTDLNSAAALIRVKIDAAPSGNDTAGRMEFMTTGDSSADPTLRMTLNRNGQLEMHSSNIKMASGNGIDFSATSDSGAGSNISELFDDYEEGQFTPRFLYNGANEGTHGGNTGGHYVKIGRMVFCNIRCVSTGRGGNTGTEAIRIGNLPFDVGNRNSGSSGHEGGGICYQINNVNSSNVDESGPFTLIAFENSSQAGIYVATPSSNNGVRTLKAQDMLDTFEIGATIMYPA